MPRISSAALFLTMPFSTIKTRYRALTSRLAEPGRRRRAFAVGAGILAALVLFLAPTDAVHAEGFIDFITYAKRLANDPFGVGGLTLLNGILSLIVALTSAILTLAILLFDAAVQFSIGLSGPQTAGLLASVHLGWGTVRDATNLFFIFALLAISIATILQIESYGMKSLLPWLIIIALLINFSLPITKVVIDASNLLAAPFYNNLVGVSPNTYTAGSNQQSVGTTFIGKAKLKDAFTRPPGATFDSWTNSVALFLQSSFNVITAWVLFGAALLFVARFVTFIFLMVLSPAAFFCAILPATRKFFDQWLSTLLKQAVVAPVFLFLMTIVIVIVSQVPVAAADSLASGTYNISSFFTWVIAVGLAYGALKITRDLSGQIGTTATKVGGAALGTAALGGGGMLLRNTAGRAFSKLASTEQMKEWADRSAVGRTLMRGSQALGRTSYDLRAAPHAASIAKAGGLDLGKARGRGGYEEKIRRQVEGGVRFAESLARPQATEPERREIEQLEQIMTASDQRIEPLRQQLFDARQQQAEAINTGNVIMGTAATARIVTAQNQIATEARAITPQRLRLDELYRRIAARGQLRQAGYAGALGTERVVETAYIKTPRKKKEAAAAIRRHTRRNPNQILADNLRTAIQQLPRQQQNP